MTDYLELLTESSPLPLFFGIGQDLKNALREPTKEKDPKEIKKILDTLKTEIETEYKLKNELLNLQHQFYTKRKETFEKGNLQDNPEYEKTINTLSAVTEAKAKHEDEMKTFSNIQNIADLNFDNKGFSPKIKEVASQSQQTDKVAIQQPKDVSAQIQQQVDASSTPDKTINPVNKPDVKTPEIPQVAAPETPTPSTVAKPVETPVAKPTEAPASVDKTINVKPGETLDGKVLNPTPEQIKATIVKMKSDSALQNRIKDLLSKYTLAEEVLIEEGKIAASSFLSKENMIMLSKLSDQDRQKFLTQDLPQLIQSDDNYKSMFKDSDVFVYNKKPTTPSVSQAASVPATPDIDKKMGGSKPSEKPAPTPAPVAKPAPTPAAPKPAPTPAPVAKPEPSKVEQLTPEIESQTKDSLLKKYQSKAFREGDFAGLDSALLTNNQSNIARFIDILKLPQLFKSTQNQPKLISILDDIKQNTTIATDMSPSKPTRTKKAKLGENDIQTKIKNFFKL